MLSLLHPNRNPITPLKWIECCISPLHLPAHHNLCLLEWQDIKVYVCVFVGVRFTVFAPWTCTPCGSWGQRRRSASCNHVFSGRSRSVCQFCVRAGSHTGGGGGRGGGRDDSIPFTPSALSAEGGDGKNRIFCHPSALRGGQLTSRLHVMWLHKTLTWQQIKNVWGADDVQFPDLNTRKHLKKQKTDRQRLTLF